MGGECHSGMIRRTTRPQMRNRASGNLGSTSGTRHKIAKTTPCKVEMGGLAPSKPQYLVSREVPHGREHQIRTRGMAGTPLQCANLGFMPPCLDFRGSDAITRVIFGKSELQNA